MADAATAVIRRDGRLPCEEDRCVQQSPDQAGEEHCRRHGASSEKGV
ncbi:MAG: hypothetical protein K1W10_09410 [Lachnospiraceae bacterium]